jgi:hypothetical protein
MSANAAILVTAFSTAVYGLATLLLVIQIWRDRVQRERHFGDEAESRKLNELRSAFYDAWGYWRGHRSRSGNSIVDASQAGRVFESLIRLECQLRLNGLASQADDLGLAIRTEIHEVDGPLDAAGVALGVLPSGYRRAPINI